MNNVFRHLVLRHLAALTAATAVLLTSACGFGDDKETPPVVSVYASGLTNPRGLTFGPDGHLYVAEAGTGGDQLATDTADCPALFNIYGPYSGGYSGRVLRVLANGSKQVVAEGLPSTSDAYGGSFGPTDLAFVGGTLYVLTEMGGCEHGLPGETAAVRRVNADGSTTVVADLSAWLAANPPHFIKDTDPATTDLEPGGVFHSMIAVNGLLYVVETNRGFVLRVDPASGRVDKLYDMSLDQQEHNPVVIAHRGGAFYVGTFGEDEGPAELAVFGAGFNGYTLPFASLHPLVGLAWHDDGLLYGVEIFPHDDPWTTDSAKLVSFNPQTGQRRELLSGFASLPNGLVRGPDGALYTSNWGMSFTGDGDGQILRVQP